MKPMKKSSIITALFVSLISLLLSFGTEITEAAGEKKLPLQKFIEEAQPGETIIIPSGEYEGPIIVGKPLTIKTDGFVQIKNSTEKPAIHIQSDGVSINGLRIIDDTLKESAAILITADETVLEHIQIQTRSFGIQLRDANRNEIRNSKISWYTDAGGPPVKMSDKGNGIDLYNSHENRMIQNEILNMDDGIYLESSHAMILEGNRIDHSRYGIHSTLLWPTAFFPL